MCENLNELSLLKRGEQARLKDGLARKARGLRVINDDKTGLSTR